MSLFPSVEPITREAVVLAALAAAGEGVTYSPVQAQKLFFILDREASHLLNGPHFHFVPYNYGPFDSEVYNSLERLCLRKLVLINQQNTRYKQYALTPSGFQQGSQILGNFREEIQQYISRVARWVSCVDFQTLVSTIYSHYPDMKVNSVFVS